MKMKATDTIHISELRATSLAPGEVFDVSDATAKELMERGLATEVKAEKAPAKKKKGK